jgi:hypothetical protein
MWLMFIADLISMNKRFRYLISALFSTLGFFMFISLPYEIRYFGLMVGIVLVVFCFWFGLGIIFEKSLYIRLLSVLLPVGFFSGFGLFVALLPYDAVWAVLMSGIFGVVLYEMFLVENVFLVAIGYKTVPLYRAAYTVSLVNILITAFFMFDTLLSYRLSFWLNGIWTLLISLLIFMYQFWAIAIELPDDGEKKNRNIYVWVPSLIIAELSTLFSFWPTGIFKGSIYLVSVIYIISCLIQADIRDRLFKRTWLMYVWIGIAVLTAAILTTKWGT